MALFNETDLRNRARSAGGLYKSAASLLTEHVTKQASTTQFDIFLSHAFDDKELLLGTVLKLEDLGYRVYLDWRDDPQLDRTKVTTETAGQLRRRMRQSKALFYAVTPNERDSVWMKWELGFKDGENGKAAIQPIEGSSTDHYSGQQFLGLYPYAADGADKQGKQCLWIHKSSTCYVRFDYWLTGTEPSEH
jgi:hypothetical protein